MKRILMYVVLALGVPTVAWAAKTAACSCCPDCPPGCPCCD